MVPRLDVRAWLVVVLVGCHTKADVAPHDVIASPVPSVDAGPSDVAVGLAPLSADGGWMQVWDEGSDRIHVAIPTGATSKRPVIVAVHGAQDRPDWSCAEWFGSIGGFAFVVCPRGVAYADGSETQSFVWTSAEQIVRASERALAAARAKWGAWMSDGPALYGGWSQASSLAFAVLPSKLFGAAVLVEIGHTPTDPMAVALAGKNLRGLGVVCSTARCEAWAAAAREPMKRAGTRYETWTAGHRGHTFDGEVAKGVSDAVAWVTSGDPQWER
jgi:hypothetical protein